MGAGERRRLLMAVNAGPPNPGSLETKKAAICKFFTLPENIRIQYDYGYSSVITIPYSVSKLVYTMLK